MASPRLRAQTSSGRHYTDPTEELLLDLLQLLQEAGDWLTVTLPGDDQHYIQAMRLPAGYLVERRSGSAASHQHALTADVRLAHEHVALWAHGAARAPSGRHLAWAPGFGPVPPA